MRAADDALERFTAAVGDGAYRRGESPAFAEAPDGRREGTAILRPKQSAMHIPILAGAPRERLPNVEQGRLVNLG